MVVLVHLVTPIGVVIRIIILVRHFNSDNCTLSRGNLGGRVVMIIMMTGKHFKRPTTCGGGNEKGTMYVIGSLV